MTVGVLTVQLEIPGSNSLKDKRQVLKGLLDVLRDRLNVSAAEVGDNDVWRRAVIGIACVANGHARVSEVLNKALERIERNPLVVILEADTEIL